MITDRYTRDGNTFYYIDGEWVLVDGEWYEKLYKTRAFVIKVAQPPEIIGVCIQCDPPVLVEVKMVTWEKTLYGRRIGDNCYEYRGFICEGGVLPARMNKVDFEDEESYAYSY